MGYLFEDQQGKRYDEDDVYQSLREVGAGDCETLFLHSDVMFGKVGKGFSRKEYLGSLYHVFERLDVKYLIVPTFSYSFCNKEDYDVLKSRTLMGAFNEFIRKKQDRYRTMDPLLSLSVPIGLKDRFSEVSSHSLGEGSGLDLLHHMDGVKFLFFGARLGNCFTYTHYVEKMRDVPYRFDMAFHGRIFDENGKMSERTQFIHTACGGVKAGDYYYFEDYLEEKGMLRKRKLGDRMVSCISEKDAFGAISQMLDHNIHYFLEAPFTERDLSHEYTMGLDGGKITHC